jgi:hypothetical protein
MRIPLFTLELLEPRAFRSLAIDEQGNVTGNVEQIFSLTTGDYVPLDSPIPAGFYVANLLDDTSESFVFVPRDGRLDLPSGLAFAVDELIVLGELHLDRAAVVTGETTFGDATAISVGTGQALASVTGEELGAQTFRDIPITPESEVYAAVDPGDFNLDGGVNLDDVVGLDRRAAQGEVVDYGPTYRAIVAGAGPGTRNEPLPVVTSLTVPTPGTMFRAGS